MKIGIISDCHLGTSHFRKTENLQNIYCNLNNKSLEESIEIFTDQKCDIIIISGDLFESPNPDVQSIILANKLLNIDIPVYIIGGNHDYSQKNLMCGYHPFDLLYGENIHFIYKDFDIIDFEDLHLTLLPYKSLNSENFASIYKGKLRDKTKSSILVIHGSVDINGTGGNEEFTLPKEIALNYDLVICGHIHMPNYIKTNTTSILTPGSIMPSFQANSNTQRPSAYIYNTQSKNLEIKNLKNPPFINDILTDDVNDTLLKISNKDYNNDLYFIKYTGSIQDVDEYIYKKALQNTLNLSIQVHEKFEQEKVEKVSDFWSYVQELYMDYYEEFQEILKGEPI